MTTYRTTDLAERPANSARSAVAAGEDGQYRDEESGLPGQYTILYWPGTDPQEKGETIGHADTLAAAWALVRDNRRRSRRCGWLWIQESRTGRALFDSRERPEAYRSQDDD